MAQHSAWQRFQSEPVKIWLPSQGGVNPFDPVGKANVERILSPFSGANGGGDGCATASFGFG